MALNSLKENQLLQGRQFFFVCVCVHMLAAVRIADFRLLQASGDLCGMFSDSHML